MKFTFSWLKDHLDTTAPLDVIAARLSLIGLEVEAIEDPSAGLAPFTIARVLEAKQHPNADRLRVAQVEIAKGKPPVEVVCGAPNCRTGMIGVFAPLGTFIPGTGITLEKKPVRGVVSSGMLCSERELLLSDDHQGIIDLDASLADRVGERYVDVVGAVDPIIEVKLTPNRPDCTGVRGIARDLAACGLGTLRPEPQIRSVEGTFACPIDIRLEFETEAASACPVFAGRYVRGVRNGPSPDWMQARLKAAGQRPISALVDITNYVQLDRGRPLHVYDADKVQGAIRARLARAGETVLALNKETYTADPTMCVIADDSGAIGLGGIIGGESTGCTEATTNVLIECAYFDPLRTSSTGRRLGVQTDARYRFERGVDPAFVEPGIDLATHWVLELCGGVPSKRKVAGKAPVVQREIAFDFDHVRRLAGLEMPESDSRKVLEALGFKVSCKGAKARVAVPTWRPDIQGAADLVEEVSRIVGLDKVPAAAMPRLHGVTRQVLTETQRRARRTRRLLAARGMVEAVTWSFIPREEAHQFGGGADALELANPISVDMNSMRPSLLPGLLRAVQKNNDRGFADIALFEIGQSYSGTSEQDQRLIAAGVRCGTAALSGAGRDWRGPAPTVSVFDVKADVIAALAAIGIDAAKAQLTRDAPAWFHPGRSATLRMGPKLVLARFGELHPATLARFDVKGPVAAFEIVLDTLPPEKRRSKARPASAQSDLLPVRRDFAFLLDSAVAAGDVVRAALGADKSNITHAAVFDLYEGDRVAPGKKSLAIEVTIQPRERSFTDAEIEAIAAKVVAEVRSATGGEIRS